jgi:D-ribulokinase
MAETPLFAGIDIGTSGVRISLIDASGHPVAHAAQPMPAPIVDGKMVRQDPSIWIAALEACCMALEARIDLARVYALAVDGTSGTILGINSKGEPVAPARMYNEATAYDEALMIAAVAPRETAAHGVSSPLGRAVRLMNDEIGLVRILHQADWIAGQFSGTYETTDENNALKTGYDPVGRRWPDWIGAAGMPPSLLPKVVPAGTRIGNVSVAAADRFGFGIGTIVVAGTTDGCASFLATGASEPGDGVTALGSTLVLKLLTTTPIFAPDEGIYSHRIGEMWLAGGASNAGGAVIAQHFDTDALKALEPRLKPDHPTGLDFYPLSKPGERFPLNDPDLPPRLVPRPADDAMFLQAMLEGLTSIEAQGYARLSALGAPRLESIRTVGGGSRNGAWTRMREKRLKVPFLPSRSEDASVGAARLALQGWRS